MQPSRLALALVLTVVASIVPLRAAELALPAPTSGIAPLAAEATQLKCVEFFCPEVDGLCECQLVTCADGSVVCGQPRPGASRSVESGRYSCAARFTPQDVSPPNARVIQPSAGLFAQPSASSSSPGARAVGSTSSSQLVGSACCHLNPRPAFCQLVC